MHEPSPTPTSRFRNVTEERLRIGEGLAVRVHPEWRERFPWLVQGTTERGPDDRPTDFALFGREASASVQARWEGLGEALGVTGLVHGRQVHGAAVRLHGRAWPGLRIVGDTDGHATRAPGLLLTVATADCVAVSVVDPRLRAVALLHAGWRGVAAGILERGLDALVGRLASRPGELHVHLGPAICGRCYEVGPEVHDALGLEPPSEPAPVDLRAALARRAVKRGVAPDAVTVSTWCTRCGDSPFFSHRGGCVERQLGLLGRAR